MKKLLILLLMITGICSSSVQAKPSSSIEKAISDCGISKSGVSISVKDASLGKNNGKVLYKLNENKPIPPASTQKIITVTTALDTLGKDYEFKTTLYKTSNNELQLKLGADPYLTSKDLKGLIESAKVKKIVEPKAVFIDDYILDGNEWGEGWQWDDELNPLMPKFSSYNIDKNLLTIILEPTIKGAPAEIHSKVFYPINFMNLVTTGKENDYTFHRDNKVSPGMITVEGTIESRIVQQIPVNYPKRYFYMRLEDAIRASKLGYYGNFIQRKTPTGNVYLVDEIKRPISNAISDILKNSNNMISETVFKVAGGKFVNNTGATKNSLLMLDEYCKKNGLNTENIRIVDGSGVSKNNLMTADFMTDFLIVQSKRSDFEDYKKILPTAGEGTLVNRMLYFKDNLRAKTGTLSDLSAITGYITTLKGHTIAFDIMINDPKSKSNDKKMAEEYIIRAIYNNF